MIESLRWRYAVKRYAPHRLGAEELTCLREAVRLTPSSFGLQPYRALFIDDDAVRVQLRAASFDQPQISEASHLVVFAIETRIDEGYVQRHYAALSAFTGLPTNDRQLASVLRSIQRMSELEKRGWATHQAYLALGFLLFAAAELRVDASPMEGFMSARYDEILGLSERGLSSVVIAALGKRSPEDRFQHFKKFRRPLEQS